MSSTANTSRIPNLNRQPPSVDFIENRIYTYHPAFSMPPSQYDPDSDMFVVCYPPATSQSRLMATHGMQVASLPGHQMAAGADVTIQPRPLAKTSESLKFWDSLFDQAMSKFKETHAKEPAEVIEKKCGIRGKKDWASMFDQLKAVRDEYSRVDDTFKTRSKQAYRKFADQVAPPLRGVVGFVPNNDYTTPISGTIKLLLEVMA